MARVIMHFPLDKLGKLSRKQKSAIEAELKQVIKEDPMMAAIVAANKKVSKVLKEKVSKKFPELR